MACCFCAMGLTEHAAQDPETLRREVESTYRQMSRSTHPDRVGLARPSQDFLFLTSVKDRCLSKMQQRDTKCPLFAYGIRGGGLTPPPAGGGPAASSSGAGAADAPPWARADVPPWAAGGSYQRTTQQCEMECMFQPWSPWPGWTLPYNGGSRDCHFFDPRVGDGWCCRAAICKICNTWAVTDWLTRGDCSRLQEEMRERRWYLGRKGPWANCWCPECSKNW